MRKAIALFATADYTECLAECNKILEENPSNRAAWLLKIRSLSASGCLLHPDQFEHEISGLQHDGTSKTTGEARPGTSLTSLRKSGTSTGKLTNLDQGRIQTGFIRPMTASRTAFPSSALGTARGITSAGHVMSSSGRMVRLGTACMLRDSENETSVDVNKLDLKRIAKNPALSRALFEYTYNTLRNTRKALELAENAAEASNHKDWWWKLQVGKCYLRLGVFREAEKQFEDSLKDQDMLLTRLYMGKVHLQMDQPKKALKCYENASKAFPHANAPLLAMARLYNELNENENAVKFYKTVVENDRTNVEALSSLATSCFHKNQPESAERYYRRLLQVTGEESTEIWNNIGLCSFFSQKFDSSLSCFEKALELAKSDEMSADVWFNIGHVALNVGDFELSNQALNLCISFNHQHGQAWNNLGVLEILKGVNVTMASSHFKTCQQKDPSVSEAAFNLSSIELASGNIEGAFESVAEATRASNPHPKCLELFERLVTMLL